jgi:hypothetical protein
MKRDTSREVRMQKLQLKKEKNHIFKETSCFAEMDWWQNL